MIRVMDCITCGREFSPPHITNKCKTHRARPKSVLVAQKAAVARDKKCVRCNSIFDLHGHHITHYSAAPHLGHDLTNIITLCKICHVREHPEYRLLMR